MRGYYFEMLGLQDDASEEAINNAYLQQVKIWHRDNAKKWAPGSVFDCARIFEEVQKAHKLLSDSYKRREYIKTLSLTSSLPRNAEENELYTIFKELKKLHEAFLIRESDFDTYSSYLFQTTSAIGSQAASQFQDMENAMRAFVAAAKEREIKSRQELKEAQVKAAEYKMAFETLQQRNADLLAENTRLKAEKPVSISRTNLFATDDKAEMKDEEEHIKKRPRTGTH
jgi:DnaJ-class molecular chaperone